MVPLQGAKGIVDIREPAAQPPLSHCSATAQPQLSRAVSVERGGGRWEKGGRGLCLVSLKELSLAAISHFLELSHMGNSCKRSREM